MEESFDRNQHEPTGGKFLPPFVMNLWTKMNHGPTSLGHRDELEEKVELNPLNWLNVAFFLLNVLFTYGIGVLGWFGNGTNMEISEKYQVRPPHGRLFTSLIHRSTSRFPSCFTVSLLKNIGLDTCDTECSSLFHLGNYFRLRNRLCWGAIARKIQSFTDCSERRWLLVCLSMYLSSHLVRCLLV